VQPPRAWAKAGSCMRAIIIAIIAGALALVGGGAGARMVAAQAGPVLTPITAAADTCGSFGAGTFICFFNTAALAGDPQAPATITVSVLGLFNPPGVTIAAGYAADRAGNLCTASDRANTATLTLTCPTGLQMPATASVTFQPSPASVTVTSAPGEGTGGGASAPLPGSFYFGQEWMSRLEGGARTFPAGWNLVGGPGGWNVRHGPGPGFITLPGPFYTYQAGDSDYETVSAGVPLPAGAGVWGYNPAPQTVDGWAGGMLPYITMPLPAGHWIMVADPSPWPAEVTGADIVYIYDPIDGNYVETTALRPLQGAWVWSGTGGTVTVSSTCLVQPCSQ